MMKIDKKLEAAIDLFLVSFIALYFEILLIRWIPSSIQVVAYFANLVLISSFLGLGLGCFLSGRLFDLMKLFPFAIFTTVSLYMGFGTLEIKTDFIHGEHLLGFYSANGVNFLLLLGIVFIFNTLLFMILGQKLGSCLKSFRPLVSYSINIAGSIAGVVVFSLLSYLMLAPFYWFFVGLAATLWFYRSSTKNLLLQEVIIVASLCVVLQLNSGSHWSPNYKIDVAPAKFGAARQNIGYFISTNNTHIQHALDLSDESVARVPTLARYREIYEFPYRFVKPERVLILGAGSGNDAAAALRRGVREVYPVEIDSFIAGLGKTLHKERPYTSPAIHLSVDDARSFIRKSNLKFDLVTFGYLDAHKVLSQFSSVRLDNFIYTKESLEDVKAHLSPNGMVSLTYLVFKEWVAAKLYAAIKDVFGDDVRVYRTTTYERDDTVIFLAGPAVKNIPAVDVSIFKLYDGFDTRARYISDDWPYLYLTNRAIPLHYLVILFMVIAFSFAAVVYIQPLSARTFNMQFFFLGAGFMLLETVSITRFALLFGSTWVVNSAVIIAILCMALLANLYAEKVRKKNMNILYGLLGLSILINWIIQPSAYLSLPKVVSILASAVVLALPLFFAGIIFASSLKEVKDLPVLFAYNLLGAILGGLCEYLSMMTGFRFLFLAAMLMYALSYIGLKNSPCTVSKIHPSTCPRS